MAEEQIQWIETEDEKALLTHIFQTDDRPELLVKVPEWRCEILIKALTGTARAEFIAHQATLAEKHRDNQLEYQKMVWFELVKLGCFHPKTKRPLFGFGHRNELLDNKNGAVTQMLAETVQRFCRLDGSVSAQAKKNLGLMESTTTTIDSQNASESNTLSTS